MLNVTCPHCKRGSQLQIPEQFAGKGGLCKHYGNPIKVPKKTATAGTSNMYQFAPSTDASGITLAISLCVVSYFVGVEMTKSKLRNMLAEDFRQGVQSPPAGQPVFSPEAIKANGLTVNEYGANGLVSLATIDLTVHSHEESTSIVQRFGTPIVAPQGGKFLISEMTVRNRLQASFSLGMNAL